METKRTRPPFLLMLLLAAESCVVLQAKSTEDDCQIDGKDSSMCNVTHIGKTCYVHFKGERKSWSDTEKWCKEHSMEMVNLPNDSSASVMSELRRFVGFNKTWLGGEIVDLGKWTYVNGDLLNTQEFPKFQHTTAFYGCGIVTQEYKNGLRYSARLEPGSCYKKLPYICRSDSTQYHGLYQPMTTRKNWFGARQICRETAGDLFYAKNGEKVDGLMSNLEKPQKENVSKVFFVGLRHRKWTWQDGREITNSNWNSDKSVSQNYVSYCLMLEEGKLTAEGCFKQGQVICQKELPKSSDITATAPTTIAPTSTQTTQMEQQASSEPTTPFQEEQVSYTTSSFFASKKIESPPTTAYFIALAFCGGSMLLMAVAFPLIICWITRRNKEAIDLQREENIYCEVYLQRFSSLTGPQRHEIPSIREDQPQPNIPEGPLDRQETSMNTPFSRTSADDVLIFDNHLYGSSDELVEESGRRIFKTTKPEEKRLAEMTSDEIDTVENHLPGISQIPDGGSDEDEAGCDINAVDSDIKEDYSDIKEDCSDMNEVDSDIKEVDSDINEVDSDIQEACSDIKENCCEMNEVGSDINDDGSVIFEDESDNYNWK